LIFPTDSTLLLHPTVDGPSLSSILRAWKKRAFEPAACRSVLEQVCRDRPSFEELFDIGAIERGEIVARPQLLFGMWECERPEWRWRFSSKATGSRFEWVIDRDDVYSVAALVRAGCRADTIAAFVDEASTFAEQDLITVLTSPGTPRPTGRWPAIEAPGIYRREHASLVIRTAGTTLLVDPQSRRDGWTSNAGRYPIDATPLAPDCVLVTHGHGDHWHLPSLLGAVPSPDTPVVVPPVPRRNLLTPLTMAAELAMCGQRVAVPAWDTVFEVGDVRVQVLPFYGEQPTTELAPCDPDLRNFGSCYRFDTSHWSAMILVDAGRDAAGDILDAIQCSVARYGPVDVLLSCCFEFPEAINLGLPDYFVTVPFDQLRRIHVAQSAGKARPITLGPRGVARACAIAQARYFLPYAHGFRGIGEDPASAEGGAQRESAQLLQVGRHLAELGGTTELVSWRPGDVARIDPATRWLTIEHVSRIQA
jgi:L-ascorbate metabolism protein UlaG (beta-lactamase superfamily)